MVENEISLSHVSFLVPSVEKAAVVFASIGHTIGEPEIWDGEGTKEIYVGDYKTHSALPLLVEPAKEGSYSRALEKRGPGIHHIAVDVIDLEKYIDALGGSGWYLHTNSLRTIRTVKTAYLARPGMPTMIEVQERMSLSKAPAIIEEIHMNLDQSQMNMMKALGLNQVVASEIMGMVIAKKKIVFKDLV